MSFGKVAGALGAESKILLWSINFGSNHVSEKLKASGRDLPLNGKSTAISFTDQLGPGQAFQSNGRGRWVRLPDVRSRRQGRPAGTAHRLERIRLLDESRELRHERRNPRRTSGHQSQRPMGA